MQEWTSAQWLKWQKTVIKEEWKIFPLIKIKIEVFYLQGEFINSTLLFV